MSVQHYEQVAAAPVEMPGSAGCRVRWLLGEKTGAPTFAMRQFEVEAGGHTPKHSHDYEHEVFVLEGTGTLVEGDSQLPLGPGDVVYVRPNEIHQFLNTGGVPLKFLCLIPNSAAGKPITLAAGRGC